MSQSLVQIYLHIVFSTKHREPLLGDKNTRTTLHRYLHGICENQKCPSIAIGEVADHVHLLCRFSKNLALKDFLRELKADSSSWIKEQYPALGAFYWQAGYGAFSISPAHVEAITNYILNQEQHHRAVSFQDEFRQLCRKYGVAIDERYVWD